LTQTAQGGSAGNNGDGGVGGTALSTLQLNDLLNATQSQALTGSSTAIGGAGGTSGVGGIKTGGAATATSLLTGIGEGTSAAAAGQEAARLPEPVARPRAMSPRL